MNKKIITCGIILIVIFLGAIVLLLNRQVAVAPAVKPDASQSAAQFSSKEKGISFEYPKSIWHPFDKGNAIVLLKQSTYPEIESESFALGDQMVVWAGPLVDNENKPMTIDAYMANVLQMNEYTGMPTARATQMRDGIRVERIERLNSGYMHGLEYYFFVGEKNAMKIYHFSLFPFEPKGTPNDIQNLKDFEALVSSAKFASSTAASAF